VIVTMVVMIMMFVMALAVIVKCEIQLVSDANVTGLCVLSESAQDFEYDGLFIGWFVCVCCQSQQKTLSMTACL